MLRRHHAARAAAAALIENAPVRLADLDDGKGPDAPALIGEGGIGAGQLEQGDLRGAKRKAGRGLQVRGDAEAPRHVGNRLRSDLLRELHGHGV